MKVRIDVQGSARNGFYAEIRALGNGALKSLCGHEVNGRHPNPGAANNCGQHVAQAHNWTVHDS